eukprot:jgi/Mesvir1/11635/Mv00037-RA.1
MREARSTAYGKLGPCPAGCGCADPASAGTGIHCSCWCPGRVGVAAVAANTLRSRARCAPRVDLLHLAVRAHHRPAGATLHRRVERCLPPQVGPPAPLHCCRCLHRGHGGVPNLGRVGHRRCVGGPCDGQVPPLVGRRVHSRLLAAGRGQQHDSGPLPRTCGGSIRGPRGAGQRLLLALDGRGQRAGVRGGRHQQLAQLLLAVTTVITFVTAKEARLARDGTLIEPVEDGDGSITGDVVDSISGDAAGADGTDALAGTGHGGQGTTGGGQSAGSQHEHRAEQGAYLRHQGSGSAGGHGGSPRTPGHHGTDGYMPLHAGQGPGHDSGDDHGHDSCHAQDYPAVVVVAHDSDTHAHPVPLSTPARRRAGWGVGDTGGVDADPHDWHARYTGGLTSPGHHHRLRRHRSWDHDGADGEGLRRALFSGDLGGEHPPHHVASDAPLWRAESLDAPWSSLRRQRAEGRADAMSGGNEAAVAEPPRAPAPGEEERPEDVGVFASLLALSPEMKRLLVVLMLTWVRACVLVRFKVWWKSVPSRHVAWWQGSWSLACVCGRSLVSLGVAEDVSCECRTVETLMLSWFRLCLPVYCERSMLVGIAGAGVWLAAKPQQAVVSGQTLPLMLIVAPPFCPDTGHHPRPLSTHLPLILATTPHPLSTHLPLILATTRAH